PVHRNHNIEKLIRFVVSKCLQVFVRPRLSEFNVLKFLNLREDSRLYFTQQKKRKMVCIHAIVRTCEKANIRNHRISLFILFNSKIFYRNPYIILVEIQTWT